MSRKQRQVILPHNYIQKDATNIVKGVALVLMFIHHFFTFPTYYVEGISYPNLEGFAEIFNEPSKICVAVFAFLTGYFYVFARKKTVRYSVKKSTDVWIMYFLFFLVMLIPAAALGCWDASVRNFLLEAVGVKHLVMTFCWYVIFYILSIFLLLPFHLLADKHILIAVSLGILLPIAVGSLLTGRVNIPDKDIEKVIFDLIKWFPCIASGYIFARYELFEKCFDLLFRRHIRYTWLRMLIAVALMAAALMGRYFVSLISFNISVFTISFSLDFIFAPMFIYGLLNVVYAVPWKKLFFPLSVIGKYSLGMWFFHCLFFNVSAPYTQPILYFPQNPILVLLWGLAICLSASFVLTNAIAPILKIKNKLLYKNTEEK